METTHRPPKEKQEPTVNSFHSPVAPHSPHIISVPLETPTGNSRERIKSPVNSFQFPSSSATHIMPLVVTSSVQKYMMVMAQRTSQSNVNSMLKLDEWVPSSGPLSAAESSGARTKRRLSFRMLMRAFRVLLGSLAVGAG